MRILVTGAQGYLGGKVVKQLLLGGLDVVATGKRKAENIHYCDLTNLAETRAMISLVRPDRIIHCAAHVPKSQLEYKNHKNVNESLLMLENLISSCRCPLIFISSMSVYSSAQRGPAQESHTFQPENIYGQGKLRAENFLRKHTYPTMSIRIPGLFGDERKSGLVYKVIHALKYDLDLPRLPNQPVLWAAMHVNDAASGIVKLSEAPIKNHQIINFGYRGKFSIDNFLRIASDIFGRDIFYKVEHPEFEFDLSRADIFDIVSNKTLRDVLIRYASEV